MYLIIIVIAFVILYVLYLQKKKHDNVKLREKMDRIAQEARDRRHRMVDNPQFPNVGGCDICTYRNYSEVEKAGYPTAEICYCELYEKFVKKVDNCTNVIDERNTLGMQDLVNAFMDK